MNSRVQADIGRSLPGRTISFAKTDQQKSSTWTQSTLMSKSLQSRNQPSVSKILLTINQVYRRYLQSPKPRSCLVWTPNNRVPKNLLRFLESREKWFSRAHSSNRHCFQPPILT